VEYLPKDLSYSAGTPPLVLCTEAASRCRKLTFAETDLTNDGVKSIVYEVTQSGRRLKEWTIPLACQCHSLFSIHLFTYSAGKQVKKGSPYSITEHRVPELIPVPGSQPAGGVSHKPSGRLPLLSARPAVTPTTLKRAATNFAAW